MDTGGVFAQRGNLTYGWDADNTANTRIRNNPRSPDFRFDSFSHMQQDGANRRWEIALPRGRTLTTSAPGCYDASQALQIPA